MFCRTEQKRYTKKRKIVKYGRSRGITKRFLYIASYKLDWIGGETVNSNIYHFKEEKVKMELEQGDYNTIQDGTRTYFTCVNTRKERFKISSPNQSIFNNCVFNTCSFKYFF